MAVAQDALGGPTRADNLDGGAGATSTHAHTVAGANRYIAALTAVRRLNLLVASVTYAAEALGEVATHFSGTTVRAYIHGRVAPQTGANNAVLTGGAATDDLAWGTVSFTGVDQSSPVADSDVSAGTAPSVTVDTVAGGIVVACASYQVETDPQPSLSGAIDKIFESVGAGEASLHAWTVAATGSPVVVAPTGNGTSSFALVVASLNPAPGGAVRVGSLATTGAGR